MRAELVESPCRSALNRVRGMPFPWSLNPYMGCAHRCTFCYVRAFERRADRPSDSRYGAQVRVKTNIVHVLREELGRASWRREEVVIGAATDPYQPAEGRYRLTRGCLEALRERRNPLGIITRGPLIVRDLDVLQDAAQRARVTINISIPTLDPEVWRRTEPGTAPPTARLRALRRLVDGGLRAGVGLAPLLPGLSDAPEQIARVVHAAREAGAVHLWANLLYLRPGTREHFLECLARDWPEQLPHYERLYARRAYLPRPAYDELREKVAAVKRDAPERRDAAPLIEAPREAEQLGLGLGLDPPPSHAERRMGARRAS